MEKLEFQKAIINRLEKAYNANKIFHSYIFSGTKHSGRLEVALFLAGLLLNDESSVKKLEHPDLFYVVSEKSSISKEQVLGMNYEMNTTSISGKCKVFIVEDAGKLTTVAQNSLLKIIEEPEGNSYVIFLVESEHQLLNTIVSRSQVLKFNTISFEHVYNKLSDKFDDKLKFKYSLYMDYNDYDKIYESEEIVKYINVVEEYMNKYFSNEELVYLNNEICYQYFAKRDEIISLVDFLIVNTSSILNYKNGIDKELFDSRFLELSKNITDDKLIKALNNFIECNDKINRNVNPSLAFDAMTIGREK